MELWYLICPHCLIGFYISTRFCQIKVSQRVSDLETQTVGSTLGLSQVTKGHTFVKTVNGFKVIFVLNLCISSDYASYLYHVSRKNLKGFQSY